MIADTASITIQQYQKQIENQHKEQKKQDTEIYVWGTDKYGQLGLGHKHQGKNYTIPKICCYNLIIRSVSCGEEHSAFITQRGHIYTIGSNEDGKLGISTKAITSSSTPCLVEDLSKIKCLSLSCGQSHTVAVMQNGEVYGWGDGSYGQLGNGSQEPKFAPTRVVSENNEFIQVQCGSRHTILLDLKKKAYVCGSNENGQLGLRNTKIELFIKRLDNKGFIEAACGQFHSLLLDEQGRVYSTGANSFGQLGIGTKNNQYEFAQINSLEGEQIVKIAAGSHSAGLNKKGEMYLWGTGVFGEYLFPTKINRHSSGTSFSDISVGNFFAAAVDINGAVWTWGANSNGELGQGDYEPKTLPQTLQALKGRHVQKICCGGGFAMALGYKLPKDNKQQQNLNEKTIDKSILDKSTLDKSNYYSTQSHQRLSMKQDDFKQQHDLNNILKNYSSVSNHISIKPNLNQNYSMIVERTAPKLKETSHSPLQKSLYLEKKANNSTSTTKKLQKPSVSPSTSSQKVLKENYSAIVLDKKRKKSVERLCQYQKENQTLDTKQLYHAPSNIDQRSLSMSKSRKKSSTISTSASINTNKINNHQFNNNVNKENIGDECISSKRISKKSLHSTLQLDDDQIERYNKKITDLEKKLSKEVAEKKALKLEISMLKENLDEIQFGQQGLNQINETMQKQYSKLYNLQNDYDNLLIKYQEREQYHEISQTDLYKCKEQINQLIKDLNNSKEESIKKEKEIFQLKDEIILLADDKRSSKQQQNQQYEIMIKQLQIELSDCKAQTGSYKNISDTYRQEIETLRKAIESYKETEEIERRQRDEIFRQNELLKKELETYRSKLDDSHRETQEYIAELRRVQKEKEQNNINYIQLEDTIRDLDHQKKKLLIEKNQLENDLVYLREKIEVTERQEVVAEQKINQLAQIKQTYEFDNEKLKHDLNIKINQLNNLNDRVSSLTQKLQDMEEKNTQLTVLLNQEIDKQAMQYKQSMESQSQLLNSTGKKPISTTDLILNNQFSHSSKKSANRQAGNSNNLIKSLIYSDQKQFENQISDLQKSLKGERSKSIDSCFNVSQKTGSNINNQQNQNYLNNQQGIINTQPFDSNLKNSQKSFENLHNLSNFSGDPLPTFSEYEFSNTKNKDFNFNSAKKSVNRSAEKYSFTPEQVQKDHIYIQENYEQKNQQQNQYKVRSASAQKLLNLIERTGDQVNKKKDTSPFKKTPEKAVTFQNVNDTSPFTDHHLNSKSNKKQQLEQIQEEKPLEEAYQSKDLLELTNVRQRLAEMRKTKDMVFSRMMDFDTKIKKFTEQQEKILQNK
ncbi:hypothetical protein ABPG72_011211 [Tetrahymena utriculariae]